MEESCMIDVGILRAAASGVEFPPPGSLPVLDGFGGAPAAPEGDPQFRCMASTGSGRFGGSFHTRKALMNNYRAHHNVRRLAHVITPTNVCVHCSQVFSRKVTASRHLFGSISRGSCYTTGPWAPGDM
eukprot:4824407-Pyramimonas_sp.AAC.1